MISSPINLFLEVYLQKEDPSERNTGTAIAEMLSVINGASIIRTHNVGATSDVIKMTKFSHNNAKAYNQFLTLETRFHWNLKKD